MDHVTRVMIVDDHPLMRKGIQQLLTIDNEFDVIAEAQNGDEALLLAEQLHPELILLDYNMQGISGLETLKRLRQQGSDGKVIILTVSDNKQDVIAMINHGADGYLLKDSEPEQLIKSIKKIASGEMVVTDKLSAYLNELDEEDNIRTKLAKLTKREVQILQEISKGLSNRDISENIHISEGTVKVHVKSLLKKLQIKSRVEAAVIYLQQSK
ncbi:two-component system response regulator NarL [Psychromonas sp. MME2]|uniref:two-component system response regulator NarL n=1 Tax=unclassified Psychromonas TaxID=2614957 RepID=UPI00339C2CE1